MLVKYFLKDKLLYSILEIYVEQSPDGNIALKAKTHKGRVSYIAELTRRGTLRFNQNICKSTGLELTKFGTIVVENARQAP